MQIIVPPDLLAQSKPGYPKHLRRHKAHPRNPACYPETGRKMRQRCRNGDKTDKSGITRTSKHLPGFDKNPWDIAKSLVCVNEDRKDGSDEDNKTCCKVGKPKPDDGKRNPREGRDRADDFNDGIKQPVDDRVPSDEDAGRDADKERESKSDKEMDHTHGKVHR